MRSSLPLYAVLLSLTSLTTAQTPDGALVPFSTLPTCANLCGTLYDVQGACVPPAQTSASKSCFCSDPRLQGENNSPVDICNGHCAAADLQKIQAWYKGFCAGQAAGGGGTVVTTTNADGSVATQTGSSGSAATTTTASSSGSSANKSWMSTHYGWVIGIVVLAVVIILSWLIACFFRRRYLRKQEREFELRPPAAPWTTGTGVGVVPPGGVMAGPSGKEGAVGMMKGKSREAEGMFVSRPMGSPRERAGEKWVVKERT